MTVLQCTRCRYEFSADDSKRGAAIPCPKCGALTPGAAGLNADKTVETKPRSDSAIFVPLSGTSATPPGGDNPDETLAPHKPADGQTFSFLTPGQSANDLGWIAHYRVVRLVGQGGMGVVFEAIDTTLQRTVALKVMKPEIAADELARQRFLREARATASVKSDHIVVIHSVVSESKQATYLAMEYLKGEPLDRWLKQHPRPTVEECVRIGMEIARGLQAAHECGLIHRDIKPSNIWLEAPSGRVKILDFGLARLAKEQVNLTETGHVMGTPAYMAPEQAETGVVDSRSDLFSLGCVLYELCTGRQPFIGPTTMSVLMAVATKAPTPMLELNPDLPPTLVAVVAHLLAKKPDERPKSTAEVVAVLEALAAELGFLRSTPASGTQVKVAPLKLPPEKKSRRTTALAALVILVGIVVVAGLLGWRFLTPERPTFRGVTQDEVRIGMSGPFDGPSKALGAEMQVGIETYFRQVNEKGGIAGRQLKLVALDDGYEPDRALANMKELFSKREVFAVMGNIGTPSAAVTIPYASENKLLFLGAFTGARLLREDPPNRFVFNFRASYEEETEAIVKHLIKVKRIKPEEIAVFAQNDAYGNDGFNGVAKALRELAGRDTKDIVRVKFERNTIQVQDAVDTILKHPEIRAVVMVPTYKPATVFIQKLKDAKRDLIFTNVSFVGSAALAEGLKELGTCKALGKPYCEDVIVTQVVPHYASGASAVVKYREALQKYHSQQNPSFSSLEGYLSAALFAEGMRIAGDDLNTDTMIAALESIQNLDLGTGAALSFGPSRHQASNKVWATRLNSKGEYEVLDLDR